MVPILLVVQFRTNQVAADLEKLSIEREVGSLAQVVFISALDVTVNWIEPANILKQYSGMILGGSGDFDFDGGRAITDSSRLVTQQILARLSPLLRYIFDFDFPTLGICFGHQLLGAFSGAKVVNDCCQMKSRSHCVSQVSTASIAIIFINVPINFVAHYVHKDTLDRVPEGAELLACGGQECQVSALRYKRNIYSTQFHPELTFKDVELRVEAFPGYLPVGITVSSVFTPEGDCTTLIRNFVNQLPSLLQSQL